MQRRDVSDMIRCMKRIWLLFVTAVALAQDPLPVAPLQFDAASVKAVQPQTLALNQITAEPGEIEGAVRFDRCSNCVRL